MDKAIGNRLKEARRTNGMHQEDAARNMGMSRPTLSAIEAGKRTVTAEEVCEFSALYKVSTNSILFGNDGKAEEGSERLRMYCELFMKMSEQEQDKTIEFMQTILQR